MAKAVGATSSEAVVLLVFRCGGTFCGLHRYPESHRCPYDYKTKGRQVLEKDNPRVVAEKFRKI